MLWLLSCCDYFPLKATETTFKLWIFPGEHAPGPPSLVLYFKKFILESLYTVTTSVHIGLFFTGPCVIYKEEYKKLLKTN